MPGQDEAIIIEGYIYIKMTIKATLNGYDFTIYQDIGIGRSFVVCSFLFNFKDIEIKRIPNITKIVSYLGLMTKL